MIEKLDKLSQDILSLLEKHEPVMLRNHEICEALFDSYTYNYKDKKGFGVAVSNKLKILNVSGRIKHEDIWYGSLKSKLPPEFQPFIEKPSEVALTENQIRLLLLGQHLKDHGIDVDKDIQILTQQKSPEKGKG